MASRSNEAQVEPSHEAEIDYPVESSMAEDDGTDARSGPAWPLFAVLLAAAAWTAFFLWANGPHLSAAAPPASWAGLIAEWSIPLVLIAALWLVAMGGSRREARRFGHAAGDLRREAAALEQRLATVNRELSLARDFIAGQSRDLESLGRLAVERLTGSAQQLETLIGHNAAELQTIGRVSSSAAANMEKVRDDLPVLGAAMRDLTNRIGLAGQAAGEQVNTLTDAIDRLSASGEESEAEIASLRAALDGAVAELTRQTGALAGIAEERMAGLEDRSRNFAAGLRASESDAAGAWNRAIAEFEERMRDTLGRIGRLDQQLAEAARERLAALHDEAQQRDRQAAERHALFDAERQTRDTEAAERQAGATVMLREQFEMLDAEIARRQQAHVAQVEQLADRGEAVVARLASARGEGSATLEQLDLLEQRLSALPAHAETGAEGARAQLAATMAEVDTLARALEDRIAAAREHALARMDRHLATHMTDIVGRLQSEAIDLTRAFNGEIEDADWNAYLAGDSSRFTRRAVRLLGTAEADRIAALHYADAAFAEATDNYCHDFEVLLREVLATRAGNALAVALLSSDMGRLYVALAQSTDRLAE